MPAPAAVQSWISADDLSNYLNKETLVDWLEMYGEANGYVRDIYYPGYREDLDWVGFLRAKKKEFLQAILRCFEAKGIEYAFVGVGNSNLPYEPGVDPERDMRASETKRLMELGVPVIVKGLLVDSENRLHGSPDLLVRADHLNRLVDEPTVPAGEESGHYRIVCVTFAGLDLTGKGLLSGETDKKVQLQLLNRLLGQTQGFEAPAAYLLGRTVTQDEERTKGCLERLAKVPLPDAKLQVELDNAIDWRRRLAERGATWKAEPASVPELRPNMKKHHDYPWAKAKKEIAHRLKDPTCLWQVGADARDRALAEGVQSYDHAGATAATFYASASRIPILNMLLQTIQNPDGPTVLPMTISYDAGAWRQSPGCEFFVDFETVNNLDDDFSKMPDRGGQDLIFMVGCLHFEGGEPRFECFVVDAFTIEAEGRMLQDWFDYLASVGSTLGVAEPKVFHWSRAEDVSLIRAVESAIKRHPEKGWVRPNFYDFLENVVRKEPVVFKGSFAFGLKGIARALHANGCIRTLWQDSPVTDGQAAMLAGWRAAAESRASGSPLREHPLMREIEAYNEVDCMAMYEVIDYLRREHCA